MRFAIYIDALPTKYTQEKHVGELAASYFTKPVRLVKGKQSLQNLRILASQRRLVKRRPPGNLERWPPKSEHNRGYRWECRTIITPVGCETALEHRISAGLGLVIAHWHVGKHQTAPSTKGYVVGEGGKQNNLDEKKPTRQRQRLPLNHANAVFPFSGSVRNSVPWSAFFSIVIGHLHRYHCLSIR